MVKKYTTNVYMKHISNYDISIFNEEDCYVTVKKINKVEKPFITDQGVIIMDDGYTFIDILPKKEKYTYKIFLDENKNDILYYFDIVKENAIDELTGVPYYIDMYTDIMIYTSDNKIMIVDEDELQEALNAGKISKKDYNEVNKVTKKLYKELTAGVNKYKNMDLTKYLK